MKRFDSAKWITENKHGKLSEMKYDNPFDQEEEDPKNPMGIPEVEKDPDAQVAEPKVEPKAAPEKPSGEKKDYTSTEDFGTLFPDAMAGGLGKKRANMPQVPADDFEKDLEAAPPDGIETNEPQEIPDLGKATTAYLDSSDDKGPWPKGDQVDVSVVKGIDPMELKPTQADIYMSNALKKVKSAEEGKWKPWDAAVLASNDGHILDGHHRWAATIVYNDKHGTNNKMNINKVAMPIKDLLKVANAYTDAHPSGVRQGGAGTATESSSTERWPGDMSKPGEFGKQAHTTKSKSPEEREAETERDFTRRGGWALENQDPRSSLYERMEKLINKNN
jgi:hypothetical protein